MEKILNKISSITALFHLYRWNAIQLLWSLLFKKSVQFELSGENIWLNCDQATNYHLIHSMQKIKRLVDGLPENINGVIIDGGANHGIFSLLAAKRFPNKRIYAIEPYPVVLPFLEKNTSGRNVQIIKLALGGKDGKVSFFTAPTSDQVGSLMRENVEVFTDAGAQILETSVEAISLKTLVKIEKIEKIAVIKLDIQGAEFAILENADEVLFITECLVLEVVLIEKSTLELLEKARKFFPYHKVINPLPYGADIIFSKQPW